jgi:hypothetical protein
MGFLDKMKSDQIKRAEVPQAESQPSVSSEAEAELTQDAAYISQAKQRDIHGPDSPLGGEIPADVPLHEMAEEAAAVPEEAPAVCAEEMVKQEVMPETEGDTIPAEEPADGYAEEVMDAFDVQTALETEWEKVQGLADALQAETASLILARANAEKQEIVQAMSALERVLDRIYQARGSEMDRETKREIQSISLNLENIQEMLVTESAQKASDYLIEVYDLIAGRRAMLSEKTELSRDAQNESRYLGIYLNKITELLAGCRVTVIHSAPGTVFCSHDHACRDTHFDPDDAEVEESLADGFERDGVVIRKERVSVRRKQNGTGC